MATFGSALHRPSLVGRRPSISNKIRLGRCSASPWPTLPRNSRPVGRLSCLSTTGKALDGPAERRAIWYYCDSHAMQEEAMPDISVTVTQRGRPPKGDRPMTDSERKRAQRTRDRRATIDAIGDEQNAPLRALLALLARIEASEPARRSAERAWAEIGRR